MKKLLAVCLLMLMNVFAYAATSAETINSIDVSQLSPQQRADLLASVNKLKSEESKKGSIEFIEEAEKWTTLGANMGKAAVGAAKEIGVAANEFVATPLGKVTMGIVVYKVLGRDIIKLIVGTLTIIFFSTLGIYLMVKKYYDSIEYTHVPMFNGLFQKRVISKYSIDHDWKIGSFIVGCVCIILSFLIGLNIIF